MPQWLGIHLGPLLRTLPPLLQELQSKELPSTRIQPDRRWWVGRPGNAAPASLCCAGTSARAPRAAAAASAAWRGGGCQQRLGLLEGIHTLALASAPSVCDCRFGNTRVIGQRQLEQFREEMGAKVRAASAAAAAAAFCNSLSRHSRVLALGRCSSYHGQASGRSIMRPASSARMTFPGASSFGSLCLCTRQRVRAAPARLPCPQVADPYTVLIKEKKLPLSLLEDPEKKAAGG